MLPKAFSPQVLTSRAASAIGIEHELLRKWRQRFGLFGTPGQPKRELTIPELLALRFAVIALIAAAASPCARHSIFPPGSPCRCSSRSSPVKR